MAGIKAIIICKKMVLCTRVVKNGQVRQTQQHKRKFCGNNFKGGKQRTDPTSALKRALAGILYAVGKTSFGFLEKLFGVPPEAYRGLGDEDIPVPDIVGSIQEMEFDEMRHFFQ